jgi:predicted Zn-dependent protease with MMP-like domain
MEKKEFQKLVEEGIKAIPEVFLKRLENVDIVIEDEPDSFQKGKLKEKGKSILLGLYEGIPQIKRGRYAQILPDKITIFQKSIERISSSKEDVRRIVKNTVWHEIAHHFGMTEEEIREAEKRKRK